MFVLTADDALCSAKNLCSDLIRAVIHGNMQVLGGRQQRTVRSLSIARSLVVHTLLAIARYSTAEIMRTDLSSLVVRFSDRRRASSRVMLLGSAFSFPKIVSSCSWSGFDWLVAWVLMSEDVFPLRRALMVSDRDSNVVGDASSGGYEVVWKIREEKWCYLVQ
jgi:hypothetical protein